MYARAHASAHSIPLSRHFLLPNTLLLIFDTFIVGCGCKACPVVEQRSRWDIVVNWQSLLSRELAAGWGRRWVLVGEVWRGVRASQLSVSLVQSQSQLNEAASFSLNVGHRNILVCVPLVKQARESAIRGHRDPYTRKVQSCYGREECPSLRKDVILDFPRFYSGILVLLYSPWSPNILSWPA